MSSALAAAAHTRRRWRAPPRSRPASGHACSSRLSASSPSSARSRALSRRRQGAQPSPASHAVRNGIYRPACPALLQALQSWRPQASSEGRTDPQPSTKSGGSSAVAEDAAAAVGASQAVGGRWFRHGGGMPMLDLAPLSGRYLSFREREEIALLKAQGPGVRAIARQLERSASTVSRELRRNAATRCGKLDYRAS